MTYISRRFEALLEAYRRADGRRWSGQGLHDATAGVVTRSYVTNLRKGRIQNPGYEKLSAIANAMGFPPELWFEGDADRTDLALAGSAEEGRDLAAKLNRLFEAIPNPKTGEHYTDGEVARMSLGGLTGRDGGLTEEEVRKLRSGEIPNPSVNQVVALADVFGVRPSYFVDRLEEGSVLLDREVMGALEDDTTNAILHKSMRLPKRQRDMILAIIQQFEDLQTPPDTTESTSQDTGKRPV